MFSKEYVSPKITYSESDTTVIIINFIAEQYPRILMRSFMYRTLRNNYRVTLRKMIRIQKIKIQHVHNTHNPQRDQSYHVFLAAELFL